MQVGPPTTLTATVANQPAAAPGDVPSGTVTISASTAAGTSTTLGTARVGQDGVATLAGISALPGTTTLRATYGGDAHHDPSSAAASVALTTSRPRILA